jgi:hypothetical protein
VVDSSLVLAAKVAANHREATCAEAKQTVHEGADDNGPKGKLRNLLSRSMIGGGRGHEGAEPANENRRSKFQRMLSRSMVGEDAGHGGVKQEDESLKVKSRNLLSRSMVVGARGIRRKTADESPKGKFWNLAPRSIFVSLMCYAIAIAFCFFDKETLTW